jgi:hypothetical protein
MTTALHTDKPHPTHAALLWLVPAAVFAAWLLALVPAPAPVALPSNDWAAPVFAEAVAPTHAGAAWQPDHSAIDWAALDAAPDPSPMSVAAYDH